ncbi:MAG: DNA polymerase III subunit psi [Methylophaga sp.]|uniref:DNA polymerase III subunit psi n=1 Tax=Methylophaga sp. TaxID=2024840 RepID=UPI000C100553|nr:DNA polymerase III subunit psi [Methylophaga sp.]MBL1458232.1 DNA polymerase III subunit psi [Methylophaga sp.]
MRLSAEQYFALDQMGIPVWEQRQDDAVKSDFNISETEIVNHIDYTNSWLVISEYALTAMENRLLRAIFGSIGISLDDVTVMDKQHLNVLKTFSADKTVALVLGTELAAKLNVKPHETLACQQLENNLQTLVGPSLGTLLDRPLLKFEMWQTIRKLRNLRA